MKKALLYSFLLCCLFCEAQQTMIYSQYTFNKAGLNPAASGIEISQKYTYAMGISRQWLGFKNAPKTNFVNFSMTVRPPRSYHYWQNLGVYIDNEENGIAANTGAYFSYAFHLLLRNFPAQWDPKLGIHVT